MKLLKFMGAGKDAGHAYSSVQVELPAVMAAAVLAMAKRIPDEALAGKGREDRPHITVKFGIESDDPESVRATIEAARPIAFGVGSTAVFYGDEEDEYDVVFLDVFSSQLSRLNRAISNATPCVETQPYYWPHITLAYVKKGRGADFAWDSEIEGLRGLVGDVTFCSKGGTETRISLRSGATFADTSMMPEGDAARFAGVTQNARQPQTATGLPAASFEVARAKRMTKARVYFEAEAPDSLEVGPDNLVVGKPFQIFPWGDTTAIDRREIGCAHIECDAMLGDLAEHPREVAITILHEKDVKYGSEIAGYMSAWEKRPGTGFFAASVKWTVDIAEKLRQKKFRFVSGDAYGVVDDDGRFHPMILCAASLVPKPAFVGMVPAEMSALEDETDDSEGSEANEGKEIDMNLKQIYAALGLKEDATRADARAAIAQFRAELAKVPADQATALKAKLDRIEALFAEEAPVATLATNLGQLASLSLGDEPKISGFPTAIGAPAALKDITEKFEALSTQFAALQKTREQEAQEKEVDSALFAAEKEGRITPAQREAIRPVLQKDLAAGKEMLAKLPKSPLIAYGGYQRDVANGPEVQFAMGPTGPLEGREFSVAETEVLMSRASAFAAAMGGIPIRKAFAAVEKGEDSDLQKRIREARYAGKPWNLHDPRNWIKAVPQQEFTNREQLIPGFDVPKELDLDRVKFAADKIRQNPLPESLVPAEVARFAQEQVQRMFATISDLQAPTRFAAPVHIGYDNGARIGNFLMPSFMGGIDERCSYPESGTEAMYAPLVPKAVGLNADSNEETSWGVVFRMVELLGYTNTVWADRRQIAMSVAIPFDVMVEVTAQAQAIELNKRERRYVTALTTLGNWATNHKTTVLSADKWDDPNSHPVRQITAAQVRCWKDTGEWPTDCGLSIEPLTVLRQNPEIIAAVSASGNRTEPATMVPIEVFIAIFGMRWHVATARLSDEPGGGDTSNPPTCPWGQDFVMVNTGSGRMKAPRFGITVEAAGYPLSMPVRNDLRGLRGSDGIKAASLYELKITQNQAGYLFKGVCNPFDPV